MSVKKVKRIAAIVYIILMTFIVGGTVLSERNQVSHPVQNHRQDSPGIQ